MILTLVLIVYAVAMTLANLALAAFGPAVIPINAFVFIGLDLSLRDWLQGRLRPWQMLLLIVSSGCLTYLLDPTAGRIAAASAASFIVAGLCDWATFSALRGSWVRRSNGSNIVGAAVDSLVFPPLAWGGLDPVIAGQMFLAKMLGGAVWTWLISQRAAKRA